MGLIPPTDTVRQTGEERVVDGVRIQFLMANGSGGPGGVRLLLPDLKALCLSEVVTANMHNIYTIRGAQRDALGWSKHINRMIDAFPQAQVAFPQPPLAGVGRGPHPPAPGAPARRLPLHPRPGRRPAQPGRKMDDIANATFFPRG